MFAHTIRNAQRRASQPVLRQPQAQPQAQPLAIEIDDSREIEPDGIEILNKLRELAHYDEPELQPPTPRIDDAEPTHGHIDQIRLKRTLTAEEVKKKTVRFDESRAQMLISQPQGPEATMHPTPESVPTISMSVLVQEPTILPAKKPIASTTSMPIIHKTNPLGVQPAKRGPGRPKKTPVPE